MGELELVDSRNQIQRLRACLSSKLSFDERAFLWIVRRGHPFQPSCDAIAFLRGRF